MSFSVLMSVYHKENPGYLKECFDSIAEQSVLPGEIVVVEDGPIGEDLKQVIDQYRSSLPLVSVRLERNVGLGEALNQGLKACSFERVARMDADDLCCPDRFEKQLAFMDNHPDIDLLGGTIEEFDTDPKTPHAVRQLPSGSDNVARFARFRCPVNHMTVMFKKTSIVNAGGYQPFLGLEDYYLWARLLKSGCKIDNLSDVLVKARVGNGMLTRRRGWTYFKQDIKLQKKFLDIGFIDKRVFATNIVTRAPLRLMPESVLSIVYQNLLRSRRSKVQ